MNKLFLVLIFVAIIFGLAGKSQHPDFWPPVDDRSKARDFERWGERRAKGEVVR